MGEKKTIKGQLLTQYTVNGQSVIVVTTSEALPVANDAAPHEPIIIILD